MNIPSFDDKGNINMYEVLQANLKDYESFGVKVTKLLEELQQKLAAADAKTYNKAKSDIIHGYLHKHETDDARLRKGKLPILFCFHYTIYGLMINGCNYYHMDDPEVQIMDQSILDCEIRRVKNPFSFYGRSNSKFIKSYQGMVVTIPKGCPIKVDGKETTSKKQYNVVVNHVFEGYYNNGVHHPSMRWNGKRGWNEAMFKDVFRE